MEITLWAVVKKPLVIHLMAFIDVDNAISTYVKLVKVFRFAMSRPEGVVMKPFISSSPSSCLAPPPNADSPLSSPTP